MDTFETATQKFGEEMKKIGRLQTILEIENIIAFSREEYTLVKIKEYLKEYHEKRKD